MNEHCREISTNDSWALIGVKGAAPGTVDELLVPRYQGYADAQVNYPELMADEGYRFVYQDQIGGTRRLSNSDMTRDYTSFGETTVATGNNDIYSIPNLFETL